MTFGETIKSGFSRYVTFSGRSSRPEYWYWVLFTMIGGLTTAILDAAIFGYNPGTSPLSASSIWLPYCRASRLPRGAFTILIGPDPVQSH